MTTKLTKEEFKTQLISTSYPNYDDTLIKLDKILRFFSGDNDNELRIDRNYLIRNEIIKETVTDEDLQDIFDDIKLVKDVHYKYDDNGKIKLSATAIRIYLLKRGCQEYHFFHSNLNIKYAKYVCEFNE
jgi:hypothetical protein